MRAPEEAYAVERFEQAAALLPHELRQGVQRLSDSREGQSRRVSASGGQTADGCRSDGGTDGTGLRSMPDHRRRSDGSTGGCQSGVDTYGIGPGKKRLCYCPGRISGGSMWKCGDEGWRSMQCKTDLFACHPDRPGGPGGRELRSCRSCGRQAPCRVRSFSRRPAEGRRLSCGI